MNDFESAITAAPDSASNTFSTGGVKPEQSVNASALQKQQFDSLVAAFPNDYRVYMFRGLFYA